MAAEPTRILVLDDDPRFREAVSAALRDAGYEVISAGTAWAAQTLLDEPGPPPRLAIVDLILPNVHGYSVIRSLKKRFAETKVLAVSLRIAGEQLEIARMLGADDAVRKFDVPSPEAWVLLARRLLAE